MPSPLEVELLWPEYWDNLISLSTPSLVSVFALDWARNSQWALLSLVSGLNFEGLDIPVQWCQQHQKVPQRSHRFLSFIHPSIHSSHSHPPPSFHLDFLTPSELYTSWFCQNWGANIQRGLKPSPCPSFQASSSLANWISPLGSKWSCRRVGSSTSFCPWLDSAYSTLLQENECLTGRKQW